MLIYRTLFVIIFSISSGCPRQILGKQLVSSFSDQDHIFNPYPEVLVRNVNAWLHGDDHSGFRILYRACCLLPIMDIQPQMMTGTVNEIPAQRVSAEVFAVTVNVFMWW